MLSPLKWGLKLFDNANQPKFSYFSDIDDHMMEFNDQLINSLKKFLGFQYLTGLLNNIQH